MKRKWQINESGGKCVLLLQWVGITLSYIKKKSRYHTINFFHENKLNRMTDIVRSRTLRVINFRLINKEVEQHATADRLIASI